MKDIQKREEIKKAKLLQKQENKNNPGLVAERRMNIVKTILSYPAPNWGGIHLIYK